MTQRLGSTEVARPGQQGKEEGVGTETLQVQQVDHSKGQEEGRHPGGGPQSWPEDRQLVELPLTQPWEDEPRALEVKVVGNKFSWSWILQGLG